MKRSHEIILSIILAIPSIFILNYVTTLSRESYASASESEQLLFGAIFTAVISLLLHFIKEYHKIEKRHKMMFESMEVLLMMITPVLVSFKLINEIFGQKVLPIVIPVIAVLFLWYIVMLFITTSPKNVIDGKAAFVITNFLYWGFLIMLIPIIGFGISFDQYMT